MGYLNVAVDVAVTVAAAGLIALCVHGARVTKCEAEARPNPLPMVGRAVPSALPIVVALPLEKVELLSLLRQAVATSCERAFSFAFRRGNTRRDDACAPQSDRA